MAIAAKELKRWLGTLPENATVAIDDGGLTIQEIDENDKPKGPYLEIGGIPNGD